MLHATFRIWPSYLASLVFHPLRKLLYLALPGICWICIFWAFILKLSYKKVTPTKILIIWLKRKFDFTNSFTKDVIILMVQRLTWFFDFFWDGWRGAHLLPHVFFSVRGEGKATLKYLLKLLVFKLEGGNCNHYFLQVMLEKKLNAADLLLTIRILTLIVAHSIFQFSPWHK